jgi:hypothetical protein
VKPKKYILIGKLLQDAEVANFPEAAKFTSYQTNEWKGTSAADLVQDENLYHLDRLSLLLMTSVTLQCPVGPHDDPGLAISVVRACNISKTGSVAVQCSKGHWAEYPCG